MSSRPASRRGVSAEVSHQGDVPHTLTLMGRVSAEVSHQGDVPHTLTLMGIRAWQKESQ